MKIIVTGGRAFGIVIDHDNKKHVAEAKRQQQLLIDTLEAHVPQDATIIQGGASGADILARTWAKHNGRNWITYHADWEKYPKAAGPIRNQEMLEEQQPDLVIAFPGGKGTADMVKRAKKAGVKIIQVTDKPGIMVFFE